MREKLNSDPKFQIGAVAVLLVFGALFLLKGMGGGGAAAPPPTAADSTTAAIETAVSPTAGAPVDPTTGLPAPATTSSVLPTVPAPPLPAPVTAAVKQNQTVALLIVRQGAIDDDLVAKSLRGLSAGGVATFIVPVSQIARYTAITQGVNVDSVPALVIVRPKNLTGGTTTATVSYGYQSPEAIAQALRDARYSGPDATYSPN